MVSSQTIDKLKQAYKEYLKENNSNWSSSSISTHCSDAFYMVNNEITENFWECFLNEDTMQEAYEDILYHLQEELNADHANTRAKGYYADLVRLKEFLDTCYQGVRGFVGAEMDVERSIYEMAKAVSGMVLTLDQAVTRLIAEEDSFTEQAYRMMLPILQLMLNGKIYKGYTNSVIIKYYLKHIGEDYGKESLEKALLATQQSMLYHYKKSGNKARSLRKFCKQIANQTGLLLSFEDAIFDGINSKQENSAWIFQANPDYYNSIDYIKEHQKIAWNVKQFENQIKEGDRVYIWFSGANGGIVAAGTLACSPEIRMKLEDDYSLLEERYEEYLSVDIQIDKRCFDKPFTRQMMLLDQRLKNIRILRYAGAVNYKINKEQADLIDAYIKILTDSSPYTEMVEQIQTVFGYTSEEDENLREWPKYSEQMFLDEVFLDQEELQIVREVLAYKKNIILEGPPGVGKTFMAKRLAYTSMDEKDSSRVMMVQFHQSYSYEDFICGFRPTETGFKISYGPFYEFCKHAERDGRDCYFIIDEINRGNLSKIFGELLMLLEADKRGKENSLKLLYSNELFYIPENVHLIGMMNTADRSLAMIDYALRRRFAFYPLQPAFHREKFRMMIGAMGNKKLLEMVEMIASINQYICDDPTLGTGYQIGHSYFCDDSIVTDQGLKRVVEYELIPLFHEYWFDEPEKSSSWSEKLRGILQ